MNYIVINGPNINMIGIREPEIYGHDTLESINAQLSEFCKELGVEPEFYQSNCEGEIIDIIHSARDNADNVCAVSGRNHHRSAFGKRVVHIFVKASSTNVERSSVKLAFFSMSNESFATVSRVKIFVV